MKAKGQYNPVTQEAGGEVSYGKTDYQERRKDTLLTTGIIITGFVVVGALVYYYWTSLKGAVVGAVKLPAGSVTPDVIAAANSETPDAPYAVNTHGEYYPVKKLTEEDYNNMLKSLGMLEPVVRMGNVITPSVITSAAAQAGAESAATINKLGLNNAYQDLPAIQKSLVTLGQGVGKIFGVDLIAAGYNMRGSITTTNSQAPTNASQELLW